MSQYKMKFMTADERKLLRVDGPGRADVCLPLASQWRRTETPSLPELLVQIIYMTKCKKKKKNVHEICKTVHIQWLEHL